MRSRNSHFCPSIDLFSLYEAKDAQSGPKTTGMKDERLLHLKPVDQSDGSIAICRNLQDALGELHTLLKQYSPTWYTQRHYERAESALRLANGL